MAQLAAAGRRQERPEALFDAGLSRQAENAAGSRVHLDDLHVLVKLHKLPSMALSTSVRSSAPRPRRACSVRMPTQLRGRARGEDPEERQVPGRLGHRLIVDHRQMAQNGPRKIRQGHPHVAHGAQPPQF